MAIILVVDDNAINRRLVTAQLRAAGHDVHEADGGVAGLRIAESENPDLVVSDILMPGMDGYEFVRRLRGLSQLAGIPVIFHTAHYLDAEAHRLAATCNVEHILPKPCDVAELKRIVALTLSRTVPNQTHTETAVFDSDHRRLITNMLVQKVQELEREIIVRRQAEERVLQLNRVYAVLSGINSLIVRVNSRADLVEQACKLAVEHGCFRIAWIGMLDMSGENLEPVAWSGEAEDLRPDAYIDLRNPEHAATLVVTALRRKEPSICNDVRRDDAVVMHRAELISRGYLSIAALPLINGDRALGCLVLTAGVPDFFNSAEMRLLVELSADISFALDHIAKAEKLDHLAYYDSLTDLANATLFAERLTQHISSSRRRKTRLAVIVADIERFENVNDSLGRHVGDVMLRQIAQRLAHGIGDAKEVARVGADRFAVIVPDIACEADLVERLDRLWNAWLGSAFIIDAHEVALNAKAGIALYPDDSEDASSLLKKAEIALRKAKSTGELRSFYTATLDDQSDNRLTLENRLRRALANDEFVLHYQPKVDLESRKLRGLEALIRWQSPDLGLVPPDRFIPLLEETGLIIEVGAWVIRKANLDHARWRELGLAAPRVAVNVSTVQLQRSDFVRLISEILTLTGGADHGIDIEVTESLLMGDAKENIEKLVAVRDLGVGIFIDDFGTGYSSLSYLTRLPAEALKIDRSFIRAMLDDSSAMTLVSTIISLAHALKLTVIAEGVEYEEQAKILRLLRCDQMQGFLISKALPFEAILPLLSRSRT